MKQRNKINEIDTITDYVKVIHVEGSEVDAVEEELERKTGEVEGEGKATQGLPAGVTQELIDGT